MKFLLSNAISFVKDRANLVFGYTLIAALITLGGFTTALWVKNAGLKTDVANLNTNLETTKSKVTTLESAKAVQDETIATLRLLRERDSEAMGKLQEDLTSIRSNDHSTRTRVSDLEKRSEKVKNYLDIPVPDELQCVLNRTCTTGNGSGAKDRASSTAKVASGAVRGTN